MALSEGTTIGPYEVVGLIGQGGMGEVYQARDTKFDRDVALEVLPEAFTSDPESAGALRAGIRALSPPLTNEVPLRDRCNFGRSSWLISQALSVTYVP